MSKLQELLREFCPDGVEYRKIEEVCEILDSKRKPVAKGKRTQGIYPYYGANGIQDYVDDYIFDGTFILLGEDGSVINTDKSPVLNWATGKIWVNNHAHVLSEISSIANLRYIYFALQIKDVSGIVRGTPPKLNQENLRNIEIPVPPLPVQEEIVRILDLFTDLAAELQAELQTRREQYEYYRDKLLTFDKVSGGGILNVTWMTMSEIGDFYGGLSGKSKSDFVNGNSKYATYMNVYKNLALNIYATDMVKIAAGEKQNTIQYGDVLFTGSSETPDECGMSSVVTEEVYEPIYLNSFCFGFRPYDKSLFSPDFLKHLLRSKAMRTEITKTANGVTRFNVSKKSMGKILLPIPPYKEQKRLATILDKFEALVNDLSEGLPAEIAAVQEQYEYYRNKLLSFPRVKVSA